MRSEAEKKAREEEPWIKLEQRFKGEEAAANNNSVESQCANKENAGILPLPRQLNSRCMAEKRTQEEPRKEPKN